MVLIVATDRPQAKGVAARGRGETGAGDGGQVRTHDREPPVQACGPGVRFTYPYPGPPPSPTPKGTPHHHPTCDALDAR